MNQFGYLLDTHALLWWLADPEALAPEAASIIRDPGTAIFFSAAGAWEMAIKRSLGRLSFPPDLAEVLEANAIRVLPITLAHALAAGDLPQHHRDPFDRIMVAQSKLEGLALLTRDPLLRAYDIAIVPC